MKELVIIPAYNEEKNISGLIEKINKLHYDYIVINDCSTDGTEKLLNDYNICHLDLPCNAGLASVTQMGFKYAIDNNYDAAVVIDGDGQHDPAYINELFNRLNDGYDYIVGSRFVDKKKPWSARMLGSRLISFFIFLKTGRKTTDPTSGMRCLGKRVLEEFSENMNFVAEPDALTHIIHNKYKVAEVQVHMNDRQEGESYFTSPWKSMGYMIKVLTSILFIQ